MRVSRWWMVLVVWLAVMVASCGGGGDDTPDAGIDARPADAQVVDAPHPDAPHVDGAIDGPVVDAMIDAAIDAPHPDAMVDAMPDAMVDAMPDAMVDAPPVDAMPDAPPLSTAKDITAFKFLDAPNAALTVDVTATITGSNIAATVPAGTNVTALVATFTTTGTSVTVGAVAQTSGVSANNFTNPNVYRVTAENGSMKDYTVTVTVAPAAPKDLTTFEFLDAPNAALSTDVTAFISGTSITAVVPAGTALTALVASFSTTGASVKVGSTVQVSGTTANNFTSAVQYIVTGTDGLTKTYTVMVMVMAATTVPDGMYRPTTWTCGSGASTIDINAFLTQLGITEFRFTYSGMIAATDAFHGPSCSGHSIVDITYPSAGQLGFMNRPDFTCVGTCTPSQCTPHQQFVLTEVWNLSTTSTSLTLTRTIPPFPTTTIEKAAGCHEGDPELQIDTKF